MAGHVLPDHNARRGPGLKLPPPRTLMILAGAGGLVLMLLMRGRAAAPAADDTTASPQVQEGSPGTPSTFADNGGQAAALGSTVSDGLGAVGSAISGLTDQLNDFGAGLQGEVDALAQRVDGLGSDSVSATPPDLATQLAGLAGAVTALDKIRGTGSPSGKAKPAAKTPAKPAAPAKRTPAQMRKDDPQMVERVKARIQQQGALTPVHNTSPAKKPGPTKKH